MKKTYKDILLDSTISYDEMTKCQLLPKYLYIYQSFYSKEGNKNIFWRQNIRGNFHLSLGSEFEDYNDCRPYMDKRKIKKIFEDFFNSQEIDKKILREQWMKLVNC